MLELMCTYLKVGFLVHMGLWLVAVVHSLLCRTPWLDVQVKNKRKSDGGEEAKRGEGHEPYDYDTANWTPWELFKLMVALGTGLLPVRLIGFVIFVLLIGPVVGLASLFAPSSIPHKVLNACFMCICKLICVCCSCYVSDVQGRDRISWAGKPGSHPILIANHISFIESTHMHWLTGGMSGCMAKSQLSNPGFGAMSKFLNVVIIDPKDLNTRDKVNSGILSYATNAPTEKGEYPCKRAFMIYPEGITNSQRGLFRFNPGAFAPGKPVLPVVQRFPYTSMNPGWVSKSKISAGNDLPLMLVRYMSQFSIQLQVKFMEVWEPNEAEKKDALLYANNLQNYFGLQLDCCITDTSNKILRQEGGPFDLKKPKEGSLLHDGRC